MTVKYKIALRTTDEGAQRFRCPGCLVVGSQGRDEKEALENIKEAIREYLSVVEDQLEGAQIREIEVAV